METEQLIQFHDRDSGVQHSMTSLPNWRQGPLRSPPALKGRPPVPSDWNKVQTKLQDAINSALNESLWPWYVYGEAGRGKTCAVACVYRHWPKGFLYWWDCGEITRRLAMMRKEGDGDEILKRSVNDCDLIVIDDIGTRAPTDPQLDALRDIIAWRRDKPLIVTGNLKPSDLRQVVDDRVASRLCEGVLIEVVGTDKRLERAKLIKA